MKRTTVSLDPELERDLQLFAARDGRPTASLVREALAEYVVQRKRSAGARPRFVAAGESGSTDTAERHEDLLFAELMAHEPAAAAGPRHRGGRDARRKR